VEEGALIDQWLHLVETEVDINVEYASYIARGFIPPNQDVSCPFSSFPC